MTDNARIVREALEEHTSCYAEESSVAVCSGCGRSFVCSHDCPIQDAITALDCLETELATTKARETELTKALAEVQAELARAREGLKPYLRHLGTCGESRWPASKCTCGLSAALAPEQKG